MGETQSEVLERDAIFLGRSGDSKAQAIEFVGGELVRRGVVAPGYVDGMKAREQTVSTYLGNGVALPHGTYESKDQIMGTAIVIAQYPDGVDWDGETARLVIGLAAIGDDHVAVLSQLADVLQDEELCERLWTTDDAAYLFEIVTGAGDAEAGEEMEPSVTPVTILNPAGLHARPAALIVDKAKNSQSDLTITKGTKTANAKSIMSVLSLGAVTGDVVVVSGTGPDAVDAVADIIAILTASEEGL